MFSDAQAQGYAVVLIFIGISGPERSDECVEPGQVTMEAEVLRPWWREITGSGCSRPQDFDRCRRGQGRLRRGSPPPPEHSTSRYATPGVARAARKRVYCERRCST